MTMIALTARRLKMGTIEALGVLALGAILALAIGLARQNQSSQWSQAADQASDVRSIGERAVDQAQSRVSAAPNDPHALTGLASAYLLRARETADPSYYSKANALLDSAVAMDPDEPDVVLTAGTLALTRHEFAEALVLGRRAVELMP